MVMQYFLRICCKVHLDLDSQLLYSEIELCLAYVRGKVNVPSGKCCSHLGPFTFQFINNVAGFPKMYHEAPIEFSFCRYHFMPILLYLPDAPTGHT